MHNTTIENTTIENTNIENTNMENTNIENTNADKNIELSMSEYGYPMMKFHSVMRGHTIAMEIDISKKQALVNNMEIKYDSPIELALLLKKIETELAKINITTIVQQVTFEDWETILKNLAIWKIIEENKEREFITVVCSIDKFAEAVMTALGYEAPTMNVDQTIK